MFGRRLFDYRCFARALSSLSMACALVGQAVGVSVEAAGVAGLGVSVEIGQSIVSARQVSFAIREIEGVAGENAPVTITLPTSAELAGIGGEAGVFILVRNMPSGVRFSAGMSSGRLWVLSLRDVAGLQLLSEPGNVGSFSLEFALISTSNKPLARQTVALTLRRLDAVPRTAATSARSEPAADWRPSTAGAAPLRPPSTLARKEEAVLLTKGEELLRQGGIAAARLIFEELAQKGSPEGALALARSYDPAHTAGSRTVAVSADLEKALTWYRRAEELGSAEAAKRLVEIAPAR